MCCAMWNIPISAIPTSTGPFYALCAAAAAVAKDQTRTLIIYSAFDFVNGNPYICIIFHSLSVMNTFQTRDTLSQPRIRHRRQRLRPTHHTRKKNGEKQNIFRIFCNRWWPENIKCCALIYLHHVNTHTHTHSDQIGIAYAQINSGRHSTINVGLL